MLRLYQSPDLLTQLAISFLAVFFKFINLGIKGLKALLDGFYKTINRLLAFFKIALGPFLQAREVFTRKLHELVVIDLERI